MKIKSYNEFTTDKDTLYIFDMDDTIVNSPSFEELAIEYLKEHPQTGAAIQAVRSGYVSFDRDQYRPRTHNRKPR